MLTLPGSVPGAAVNTQEEDEAFCLPKAASLVAVEKHPHLGVGTYNLMYGKGDTKIAELRHCLSQERPCSD